MPSETYDGIKGSGTHPPFTTYVCTCHMLQNSSVGLQKPAQLEPALKHMTWSRSQPQIPTWERV